MNLGEGTPERIHLSIISPEEVIYDGEVLWVQLPLENGLIGIWPGHAPLVGALASGAAEFDTGHGIRTIRTNEGLVRVDPERCVLLLRAAVSPGPAAGTPSVSDLDAMTASMEGELANALAPEELDALQDESRA